MNKFISIRMSQRAGRWLSAHSTSKKTGIPVLWMHISVRLAEGRGRRCPEQTSERQAVCMSSGFGWEFLHQRPRWKSDQGRLPTLSLVPYIYVHMCMPYTHVDIYAYMPHLHTHRNIRKRKEDHAKCSTAVNDYLLFFQSEKLVWKQQ